MSRGVESVPDLIPSMMSFSQAVLVVEDHQEWMLCRDVLEMEDVVSWESM